MDSKKHIWDGECAKALRKFDKARQEKLRQELRDLVNEVTIWDFYSNQRGGSCNG